ncbi:diaminopimelate decarboxylase [Herbiconiux sp. L3-i23]|uniref:diaminopimelate decarboxylase n=1 Tax=Herbiconiux sp. L3-i23 TaxID=2905871 RepID=UPI0020569C04|nr:diaminopimelate decarboxylase [Herbiconiux sp. L3-i23]BDI21994.1 diaminopimelate decarboxylase [Herbiconiux sp. L3-i23]
MPVSPSASPLAPTWLRLPDDPNLLAPSVWPSSAARDADGGLVVGEVSARTLADEYGTPLYVIDEADVRERATATREAFESAFAAVGTSAKVYYAGKAFLSVGVARWMAELGLGIDVASLGEFMVALAADVDPARIGFHGNNKSLGEIASGVRMGVGSIVLDSRLEIDRVADEAARAGVRQKVRLRVNSGVHASTHEFLATSHEDQKFGVPLGEVEELVALIRGRDSLDFLGLHCHIGSQIFDTGGFSESARRLLAVHKRLLDGGPVPELNLGGGFGIAYTENDDPTPIGAIARQMAAAIAETCAELGIGIPAIAVEPGRSIVGPGGITVYEVGMVKDVTVDVDGLDATRRYVSVDGGMSDNLRTALYGADYTARIASRVSTAAPQLVRVVGKHCESGDIVVGAEYLPADIAPGDLLAVAATGAYCWSLSNNYNYLGRPAVVAVRDGETHLLIRRETEADLLRRDADFDPTADGSAR